MLKTRIFDGRRESGARVVVVVVVGWSRWPCINSVLSNTQSQQQE